MRQFRESIELCFPLEKIVCSGDAGCSLPRPFGSKLLHTAVKIPTMRVFCVSLRQGGEKMQQPPNKDPKLQWQQPQVPLNKLWKGLFTVLGVIFAVGFSWYILVTVAWQHFVDTQNRQYEIIRPTLIAEYDATKEAIQATEWAATTPLPTNASLSLSGEGSQVTPKFQFQQGLTIFKFTHSGSLNFIVHLVDRNSQIDYLVNAIGSFDGSKAQGIKIAGSYYLDIQSDGKWTITIQQPRPTTAPYTTTLHGKGQAATQLFSMQSGLKTITMTHDGTSNFTVLLLDREGNVVEYMVNEIGKFNGSKAEAIQNDGIYLFDVQADGNWTISIQ